MKTKINLIFGSILLSSGIVGSFVTFFVKAANDNGTNVFLSAAMGLGGIVMIMVTYSAKEAK